MTTFFDIFQKCTYFRGRSVCMAKIFETQFKNAGILPYFKGFKQAYESFDFPKPFYPYSA